MYHFFNWIIQGVGSHAGASKIEHVDGVAGQEGNIGRTLQCVGDVVSGLELSHGDDTGARLGNGLSDESGSFSFAFSAQNSRLGLLLALEDNEFGTFSPLLCYLFRLDSLGEVRRELKVSD